jgi:hypothetical protein
MTGKAFPSRMLTVMSSLITHGSTIHVLVPLIAFGLLGATVL